MEREQRNTVNTIAMTEIQPHKTKWAWLFYILFASLMIFTLTQKLAYFQDELLSYCLANNNEVVVKMAPIAPGVVGNITGVRLAHGFRYTPASQAFTIMTSVPLQGRFNYANVWKNQADDTHPPLYYAILHTICSFFPGTFSRWYAGAINIFFALLMLFIARKLVREFTDDKFISALVSLTFACSPAILNSVALFRMYVTSAFWIMLQTYVFVKQTGKPLTKKFYFQIFLITLGGALTHYYCALYLFLLACVFAVLLLHERDYKSLACFSVSQLGAGAAAIAIFPAMFTHIFIGDRGAEFVHNALILSDYAKRISAYWDIFNGQLYGKLLPAILILIIMFVIYKRSKTPPDERKPFFDSIELKKYCLIFIPVLLYFFALSKIAPVLAEFAYADIKYLHPVFATALVGFLIFVFCYFKKLLSAKYYKLFAVATSVLVVVASFYCTNWDDFYLYRYYQNRLVVKEMYADTDCVCFYKDIIPKYLYELSHYNSLTLFPMPAFNPDGVKRYLAQACPGKLVICFAAQGGVNTDAILATLNPELEKYSVERVALGNAGTKEDTIGDGGAIYHLTRVRP